MRLYIAAPLKCGHCEVQLEETKKLSKSGEKLLIHPQNIKGGYQCLFAGAVVPAPSFDQEILMKVLE